MSYCTSDNDARRDDYLLQPSAAAPVVSSHIQYHQHHDRRHIQPTTTPFRPLNETTHSQVINTSNQNSTPFQQSNYPKSNLAEDLSDGGVPIYSSDVPHSQSHMTPKPNQKVPQFPKRVANSAVRRTPQASALVLSPPRPGHSSCMRNIFSVSSIGRALPQEDEGFISYPVLPSLSRTPSSAKQESQARQPGNIVVPPLPTPAADSAAPESKHQLTPTRSSSSSESWSGDSGYFISGAAAHIRHPVRPYTPNSQTQIDEWLSRVSPDYGICQVDGAADADAQECTTTEYTSEDDASILAGRRIARTAKREEATLTQQPSSNTNQKSKAITQAPFLPSNPLSPSVCLNRGSSLSQSSGNVRDPDTPTKKTRPGPSVQSRGSVISEAQVKSSNRLEEKENSAVTYKAPTTYEWQVSGPTAARAQFWRSPLSRRGGLARASMRGAGSSRGPH